MDRSSREDPRTPDGIMALARRHIGMGTNMFFAPSIPPDKLDSVRRAHALHLPPEEPILVIYDGTLFGSAEDGFVVTTRRLCWKNLWEHPRQIEWDALDPSAVKHGDSKVLIAGGDVSIISGDRVTGAAAFFIAMAARGAADQGPYRAPELAGLLEGSALLPDRVVALARAQVGEVGDVFYHPSIPPVKERHARAVHRVHLPADEPVAMLYDDTVFGSAEEGFLLTSHRLCWKNLTDHPMQLTWSAIDPEGVTVKDGELSVMGGTLQLTSHRELVESVAELLRRAAEEARSGSRR
jgi:hypothetical protein